MTDTAASDATPQPEPRPDQVPPPAGAPGGYAADPTVPGAAGSAPAGAAGAATGREAGRVDQFRADMATMKVREPAAGRDRLLLWLGVVGMVVGLGLGIGAMFLSMDADGPLQQRDAIVQGLFGLIVAVVGAAFYVKAALAGFLRFWMARVSYELHTGPDR